VRHRDDTQDWKWQFRILFTEPTSMGSAICQAAIPVVFSIWLLSFMLDMPFYLAELGDVVFLYVILFFIRQRDEARGVEIERDPQPRDNDVYPFNPDSD
jgi:hypothetical protein